MYEIEVKWAKSLEWWFAGIVQGAQKAWDTQNFLRSQVATAEVRIRKCDQ